MVCVPSIPKAPIGADAFNFSGEPDAAARTMQNLTTLWTAPWKAWWAVVFEAMETESRAGRINPRD